MTQLAHLATAGALVYLLGYVAGALLVNARESRTHLSLSILRTFGGLALTTMAFFASLLFSTGWFVGPIAVCLAAAAIYRQRAFALPRVRLAWTWDGGLAALLALAVIAPVLIACVRMASGPFPPVFFNVDTAYFLEKVHALVQTSTYPPESLGVFGGRRAYHFGVHGMAALISRGSGLAPHHSLFLVVLPFLAFVTVAAATVLARSLSPPLPLAVTVPMLLVSVPTLWYPFWDSVGPSLWTAATTLQLGPLKALAADYEMWGAASNNGQNLAGHALTLASLAGIAAVSGLGWRLPIFFTGCAFLFKSPTGVALAAGFCAAHACRVVQRKQLTPLIPAMAAAAVFGIVYVCFWKLPPLPVEFTTEMFPLFHLKGLYDNGRLLGFGADVVWLLLPALIALPIGIRNGARSSLPLLFFAVAPFAIVNVMRSIDLRPGFGVDDDWVQILLPVPLILRAFALSVVADRWPSFTRARRVAFVVVAVLSVTPAALVAARYSYVLLAEPERGHEYADNRPLGEALAVIPVTNTLIVTNDLRYPAEGFGRDNRQMQIPALFGHQAFAVNYAYEAYAFSRERMALQRLLRAREWSSAIDEAARANHWTHLLIRNDYAHPEPIPLEQVFDNGVYSVFRFPQ